MEYVVVNNWVKRQELKDACMGQQYVQDAQCSFVFCGKDEGAILREGFPKYMFDCAFACSQAHLMAAELGLGSCIIGNFIPDGSCGGTGNIEAWYPEEFQKYGYQTDTIGKLDVCNSNLLAWKRV